MFQIIKIQFEHGEDSYSRSHCRKRTNQDGTGEDKGSKGMENTNESKGRGKFTRIHQLLLILYL